jgi:hypothetical protein
VYQGKFTTETQRARRFLWGYPRTHSQTVRASSGSSRRNTSILKQLPRTDAEFPNAKKRRQPLQQTFFSPADLGALCASVVKFLLPASYRSFGMNSFALATLPTNLDSRETQRSISTKSTISTVECMYRIGIETSTLGMPRLVG